MSIKVIGAGMARTGTKSLKKALERLGYNKCFHMDELMQHPNRLKYIKELHKTGSTDWDKLFEGYQAAVDNPMCLYYKEQLEQYPDAKVILTIREAESWYQSVNNTIYRIKPKGFWDILKMIKKSITFKEMRRLSPIFMQNDIELWDGFFKGKFENKATAIKLYHEHNEAVQQYVPSNQLLVIKISDGWQPICEFLGKDIPKEAFPNLNQQEDLNAKIDKLVNEGIFEV